MALKNICQVALASGTDTQLVPVATSNVGLSSNLKVTLVNVCNLSSSAAATLRLWLRIQGEATANKQYLFYDLPIQPSDSLQLLADGNSEIGMMPGDVLMGRASTANLVMQVFGETV